MTTHARLTNTEREVMKQLARGKAPKEIADSLGTSRRNIHNHFTKIKDKLGAETLWQACAIFGAIHRNRDFIRDIPAVASNKHPWKRF